jgi:hypothetical protein
MKQYTPVRFSAKKPTHCMLYYPLLMFIKYSLLPPISDVVGVVTRLTDLIPSRTNQEPRRHVYLKNGRYVPPILDVVGVVTRLTDLIPSRTNQEPRRDV